MGRAGLRRLARARSDEKYASLERSAQEKYQELQQSSAQTLAKTQQSAADAEAQLTKEAAAAAVLAEEKYNSLVAAKNESTAGARPPLPPPQRWAHVPRAGPQLCNSRSTRQGTPTARRRTRWWSSER